MPNVIASPDTLRKNRVPPGQVLTDRWPVLHHGHTVHTDPAKWTFKLSGLIEKPVLLNFEQFTSLPHVRVMSDIHCVTTWSRLDNLWEGVGTSVLRDLTRILPEAKYVMVYGAKGFTTNLTLEDFFAEDVLFARRHDEEPISDEHGGPVRLVVPRLYFWKSAKWVEEVEFISRDRPGFWESYGYHNHGDPWTEERYGA